MVDRKAALGWLSLDQRAPLLYRQSVGHVREGQALDAVDAHMGRVLAEGRGLVLLGDPGNGKTLALWYAMNWASLWFAELPQAEYDAIRQRYLTCAIYDYRELAAQRISDVGVFNDAIHSGRVLVVDEIGAEVVGQKSGWQQETFELLIDARYRNRLPTLLAGNLSRAAFKARYGERVVDRLREWADTIELSAASYRPAMAAAPVHVAQPTPAREVANGRAHIEAMREALAGKRADTAEVAA